LLTPVTDLYQDFRSSQNLRILVYSGDVDAIVPYTGTRQWIANLQWEIVDAWRPWTIDQQVGGYVQVFDGLTFATVRDAGHMVPETQPKRAFHMFSHFLANKPL
jgi:serine carboxypeptidase-like clade 2